MAAATLEKWIGKRQMGGRYAFLRSEAIDESGLSAEAVKKALQRMTARGRVAKAKDYFYVFVVRDGREFWPKLAAWGVAGSPVGRRAAARGRDKETRRRDVSPFQNWR